MAAHLDKGNFGEQGAGFFFGAQGYFLVEGPGGSAGHAANAVGFDGVAFNAKTNDLIIYDNKAFASNRDVRSATAVDPSANLARNLDGLIARLRSARDIPRRIQILDLLGKTKASLTTAGIAPPRNVRIAITNFGGNSSGITAALRAKGLTFIDMTTAPKVPNASSRIYFNSETIPAMGQNGSDGADAHNIRRGRVDALAYASTTVAQSLNDFSVRTAVKRELARLSGDIGEALITRGGALVVIRISAASPAAVIGAVTSRQVESAYVAILPPGLTREKAIRTCEDQCTIGMPDGPHVTMQTLYYWFEPPFPL
ncbi:hypothetical protein JMJ55_25395 [Belnapia sp. T6]|uniref:Uncharacterized protein n=1 Tax=Belnapia mucosa TaxID=2804532 RepID=A0ABS1VC09_9PROT|nr:hypothetical protein [Belnapia mucosa]MBL6458676.1 hypothetical protein [Belnapia mucosa]